MWAWWWNTTGAACLCGIGSAPVRSESRTAYCIIRRNMRRQSRYPGCWWQWTSWPVGITSSWQVASAFYQCHWREEGGHWDSLWRHPPRWAPDSSNSCTGRWSRWPCDARPQPSPIRSTGCWRWTRSVSLSRTHPPHSDFPIDRIGSCSTSSRPRNCFPQIRLSGSLGWTVIALVSSSRYYISSSSQFCRCRGIRLAALRNLSRWCLLRREPSERACLLWCPVRSFSLHQILPCHGASLLYSISLL